MDRAGEGLEKKFFGKAEPREYIKLAREENRHGRGFLFSENVEFPNFQYLSRNLKNLKNT